MPVTLAAKLRSYTRLHQIEDNVQVSHFHDWCADQLRSYQVEVPAGAEAYFERQVASVIRGVESAQIPRAQYGAVLINEAHDFQPEWLKLVTGMVDPETDSLLLLYDDAQSIYKKSKLGFSLSSVGVQARGRTTILKLNYRNTRQILSVAYRFAHNYMRAHDADEDGLPIVQPEAAGIEGLPPVLRRFDNKQQEHEVRLLYIAMTRAMEQLLIPACGNNELTEQLAVVIEDVG